VTDLVVAGIAREFVVSTTATVLVSGVVREFVVAPGVATNRVQVSGVVREFVLGTGYGSLQQPQYAITVIT
jgi:hypothetical protein